MSKSHRLDLTGDWTGHYEQAGSRHGIAMSIVQRGDAIAGKMVDSDTLFLGQWSAQEIGSIVEAARRDGVDLGAEDISDHSYAFSLPEDSTIDGVVDGDTVQWTKTYRGAQSMDLWIGDATLHTEIPDHAVQYRGSVDAGARTIRGTWEIRMSGDGEDAVEQGGFELRWTGVPDARD